MFAMKLFRSGAFIFVVMLLLAGNAVFAEEGGAESAKEGAEGEKPKGPPPKQPPDSAISIVLELPEVKAWQTSMESKGHSLDVWGEAIKTISGDPYWEVGVGEATRQDDDNRKLWAYFCVNKFSKDVLVEKEDTITHDITYISYAEWKKRCHPLYNFHGQC
jgi:hypothetical protein